LDLTKIGQRIDSNVSANTSNAWRERSVVKLHLMQDNLNNKM